MYWKFFQKIPIFQKSLYWQYWQRNIEIHFIIIVSFLAKYAIFKDWTDSKTGDIYLSHLYQNFFENITKEYLRKIN